MSEMLEMQQAGQTCHNRVGKETEVAGSVRGQEARECMALQADRFPLEWEGKPLEGLNVTFILIGSLQLL